MSKEMVDLKKRKYSEQDEKFIENAYTMVQIDFVEADQEQKENYEKKNKLKDEELWVQNKKTIVYCKEG